MMIESPTNRIRAIRARHSKSRNGCLTCRVRRIRCDETLPFCRNCQGTGRLCEGPKDEKFTFVAGRQPSSRKHSPKRNSSAGSQSQICGPILLDNRHDAHERRAFDFFLKRSAPLLAAGAVNSVFWRTLIPQLAHSNAVVWDAVIVVATLMEHPIARLHVVHREGTGRATKPQQLQALIWYSRAMSGVKRRTNDGDAITSALLTCILFACVESQQGNSTNVFNLVQHGLKLFANYWNVVPNNRPPSYQIPDEIIIPYFSQLIIFLATFRLPLLSQAAQAAEDVSPTVKQDSDPDSKAPGDLKSQLSQLMFLAHELIRAATLIIDQPQEISMFLPRRISILNQLQQWRSLFDAHMKQDGTSYAEWNSSFLLMHYNVTYIWVSISLSFEESATDQYTDGFREVISQTEKYIHSRLASVGYSSLMEIGAEAIPPLYFTATKCRHPKIRRQALLLIERLPKTDIVWATIPVVAILESLISFEERSRTGASTDNDLPAEAARVHHVKLIRTAASPNIAANFVTFTSDDAGRRIMEEHLVNLDRGKKLPGIGTGGNFPPYTCLPRDASSSRLVMPLETLSTASPTELSPLASRSIEHVI